LQFSIRWPANPYAIGIAAFLTRLLETPQYDCERVCNFDHTPTSIHHELS